MPSSPVINDFAIVSDAELVALIKNERSHKAFETLVKKYTTKLYSLAFRMLGNQAEAEDVVQESFVKLWEQPQKWHSNKNAEFLTWFYRVVVNACIDRTRKKKINQISESFDIQSPIDLEKDLDLRLKQADLEKLLKELPQNQRIAVNLCFYEDLSNKEAAEVMNLNLKALQSLLMRAKEKLKIGMKNIYKENSYEVSR